MIRRFFSIAALSLAFAAPALAQSSPLVLDAPAAYGRAKSNMFKELAKGRGMAHLNNSVNTCYGIVGHDLKKAQYCYALHAVSAEYDTAVLQKLGINSQTPGFTYEERIGRFARVCLRLGYGPEQCGLMLREWRVAWGG